MTIYYTAKEIEDMAAKGIRQLEVGPGVTLTDFARETAQQLGIALVKPGQQQAAAPVPAAPSTSAGRTSKYNKPSGCMHGNPRPAAPSQSSAAAGPAPAGGSSNTVNRLIDLMGNAMKRGG
jgi:hypothetical protein